MILIYELPLSKIDQIVAVTQQLPEFDRPYSAAVYEERLKGRPHLITLCKVHREVAGIKVGYEREQDGSFYSWMGGVLPEFRRMGIARMLAEYQEVWAEQQGYKTIRFKTRNRHRAMLLFAISRGFQLLRVDPEPDIAEHRIWLEKPL